MTIKNIRSHYNVSISNDKAELLCLLNWWSLCL